MQKTLNAVSHILNQDTMPSRKKQMIAVITLAWPAIIEQIMITMVQYIDTAMVGGLGQNATASIGITSTTIWLFNGFLAAAGMGFSVQVAQYVGAKREEDARDTVRQAVLFNIFFGLFTGTAAVVLSFWLPGLLGADPAIIPEASRYFRIIGYSMPFLLTSTMISSIIRCSGDMKTPMVLNILINVFNIILNFLFIYPSRTIALGGIRFRFWGAGLGVTGAAIGSAVSTLLVSILLFLVLYLKKGPVQIHIRENYRFTKECVGTAVRIGIPVALERATLNIAQIVMTLTVSGLGTAAVAANHIAITAEALSYLPAYGISAAATTLVGQAIGAKQEKMAIRFSRISTYLGVALMSFTGMLLYLFAPQLISLFTQASEVKELGVQVLRIEAFAEPLFAASIVVSGALRGAGDSRCPFLLSFVSMWGVRIPLAVILAPRIGLAGVWIAMCLELCVRGVIFLIRLYSNKWLQVQTVIRRTGT